MFRDDQIPIPHEAIQVLPPHRRVFPFAPPPGKEDHLMHTERASASSWANPSVESHQREVAAGSSSIQAPAGNTDNDYKDSAVPSPGAPSPSITGSVSSAQALSHDKVRVQSELEVIQARKAQLKAELAELSRQEKQLRTQLTALS